MKRAFSAVLSAGVLLAATACSPTTTEPTVATDPVTTTDMAADTSMSRPATAMMMTDEEFMKMVATGGHNEMGLSQVAMDKGASGATKSYAGMMINDHKAAGEELKTIAKTRNVMLPTEIDAEHMTIKAAMKKLTGEQVTQKYAQQMVTDHQKTVDAFQSKIQNGKDAEVKAFATKMLPTIQAHLEAAKKLPGAMAM